MYFILDNLLLLAGENRSVYCFVEELPPPTVRWLKNNKILKERKNQQGKYLVDLALNFPEVDLHHAGNYTCEANKKMVSTEFL